MYFNCMKLFSELKYSKADGSYPKEIIKIQKQDLIIFDDFGLQVMDQLARLMLLEILEDRYDVRSTIIISQLPVAHWHEVIGDATIADAICDRILHTSYKIELKGESMRKNKKINS
jgi:DNA replication protein DnaC